MKILTYKNNVTNTQMLKLLLQKNNHAKQNKIQLTHEQMTFEARLADYIQDKFKRFQTSKIDDVEAIVRGLSQFTDAQKHQIINTMPSNEAVRTLLIGYEDEQIKQLYEGIALVEGEDCSSEEQH